jgi:hypothetical protein
VIDIRAPSLISLDDFSARSERVSRMATECQHREPSAARQRDLILAI